MEQELSGTLLFALLVVLPVVCGGLSSFLANKGSRTAEGNHAQEHVSALPTGLHLHPLSETLIFLTDKDPNCI